MKSACLVLITSLIFTGCPSQRPSFGLHRLSDQVEGTNREVQAILERISRVEPGVEGLLEAFHPDLRLIFGPVEDGNLEILTRFKKRLEYQRDNLGFAVTVRHHFGSDEVVEVVVSDGPGAPAVWYFLRKDGVLLLRAAGSVDGYIPFKQFVLKLPDDVVEHAKQMHAAREKRARQLARDQKLDSGSDPSPHP